MTTINRLTAVDSLVPGDQVPVYKPGQGDARLNQPSGESGIIDSQTYVSPRTGYSFGRTCPLAVNAPLMLDQLHPNYTLGGPHKYEQLAGVLDS